MLKEIEVTGYAWARGRNGVFKPKTVTVMDNHISGDSKGFYICVESKRAGHSSPIAFSLTKYDAEQIACAILGIESRINGIPILPSNVTNMAELKEWAQQNRS